MIATFNSETARFTFTTYLGAAEALLVVMEDMRSTKRRYRLTGRSPEAIVLSGMVLEGEIAEVSERVALISGATRHDS